MIARRISEALREQSSGRRRGKFAKQGGSQVHQETLSHNGHGHSHRPPPKAWRRLENPAAEGGWPGRPAAISQQRGSTRKQGLPPPPPVGMEKELKTTWRCQVCNYVSAKPGITRTPASSVITRFQDPRITRPLALRGRQANPPHPHLSLASRRQGPRNVS